MAGPGKEMALGPKTELKPGPVSRSMSTHLHQHLSVCLLLRTRGTPQLIGTAHGSLKGPGHHHEDQGEALRGGAGGDVGVLLGCGPELPFGL